MTKTHDKEAEELYQQCRDLVRWGISNRLLHRPPDEPADQPETGEDMIADAMGRAVRLSIGNRNAAVRTDYEGFDETITEPETEPEAEQEAI